MKELLKNRGYKTILQASLLNGMGNSLYNIVFVIYASTLPFRELAVTLASLATLIPSLLDIIISYFADQTRHKTRNLIVARILQGLLFVLLAVVIKAPGSLPLFLGLLAINIFSDCLGTYGGGLVLPFVKRLVPATALEGAMGLQTSSNTLVQLVFQGVGAWLIVLLHHDFSLFGLMNAGAFFAAALLLYHHRHLFMAIEPQADTTSVRPPQEMRKSIITTIKMLAANQFLKYMILFALMVNTIGGALGGLTNLTLLDRQELWFGNYGNSVAAVNILISLGIIAGAVLVNDLFKKTATLTLVSLTMAGIGLLAFNFVFVGNKWLMAFGLAALGYMMGKINPRLSAFMLREIPEDRLAVTSGVLSTMVMLGGPLGQVVLLGVANWQTPESSWLVTLGIAIIVALLAWWSSQRVVEPSLAVAPVMAENE